MRRMPATPDSFAHRVSALRREHNLEIVNWVGRRVVENIGFEAQFLKGSIERAIDWSAVLVDAAIVNLGRRGWTRTRDALVKMAGASLSEATRLKTDGAKGMPLLLKAAMSHVVVLELLGRDKAQLVYVNLEQELRMGLVPLGEARGQALYDEVRKARRGLLVGLRADAAAAGERSLHIAPEQVLPLPTGPGGRTLSPEEERLTGHWINAEWEQSGNATGRFDLHMVLLTTGHLLRTNASIVFSSLQDSAGNWVGSLDSIAGLSRAERGRWNAAGGLLTLEMDDGSAYEFRYVQEGARMSTTNTNGGARRYWTRSRR